MSQTEVKNQPAKRPFYLLLLKTVAMGGVGLLFGFFIGKMLKKTAALEAFGPQGSTEKIVYLGIAFFAIWLVIAIHELGHLCAGLFQGFRMALYTAGLLGVRGTEHGVQFFLNTRINAMGGLASTLPTQLAEGADLRKKFIRIVAAGPLASLVLSGVAALGVYQLMSATTPDTGTRYGLVLLGVTSFFSAFIFLATIIPSRAGGFMSDGARLLSLMRGGAESKYEEATLTIAAYVGAGKLPGEYPETLVQQLMTRTPDNLLGLNGHFTAFLHYFDREDLHTAAPIADAIWQNISAAPPAFQHYYINDVAFFYAFMMKDKATAQQIWSAIQKTAPKKHDSAAYRVQAALALLEGNKEIANALVQKGRAKISDLPLEGQRNHETKWLQKLEDQTKTL
jgi:Peptidase family M50